MNTDCTARRGSRSSISRTVVPSGTTAGAGWCWAVTSAPGCRCGLAQSCQLKVARESDNAGVQLSEAHNIAFDPSGTLQTAGGNDALLQSRRGERLRVSVSALGRASICAPDGGVPGYPSC